MKLPTGKRGRIALAAGVAVVLVFGLWVAGQPGPGPESSPIHGSSPTTTRSPIVEPSDEPSEEPSEDPSDEPSEEPKEEPVEEPKEEPLEPGEAPAKFTGVHAGNYEDAYTVCSIFGVKEVAREFRTARDPVSAAEGYASEYRAGFRQAVFEGCLAGFRAKGS